MAESEETLSVAGVPRRIDAKENPELARLAGFPVNIAFFGLRRTPDGKPRMISVVYRFDADTYREDERRREMCYFPERREGGFHISISLSKPGGVWSVDKYRGDQWLGGGGGATFEGAMLHASQAGLVPGEAEATNLGDRGGGGSEEP
jgi:hypothetical protein